MFGRVRPEGMAGGRTRRARQERARVGGPPPARPARALWRPTKAFLCRLLEEGRKRWGSGSGDGHGWLGCSQPYVFPPALNVDYGEPKGLCAETSAGSGVFVREWTKATVSRDCNTWTPKIVPK